MNDILVPTCCEVLSVTHDTHDVFTLALNHEQTFFPGQFNMLYQFGFGEAAISLSGHPKERKAVHTIRAVGSVTKSLQKLKPGDEIGVRGPFGTPWPLAKTGCDVLVIAGGIGFAPLRSALFDLAERRSAYKNITLLYGTRTVEDILYKEEMEAWKKQGIEVVVTLDFANESWRGHVGVVTRLIHHHLPNPENTLVLICGPEIMLKFALNELAQVDEQNIYLSMERNVQCAAGFCGHCLYGPYFLCKEGPVFSYAQVKNCLNVKEL